MMGWTHKCIIRRERGEEGFRGGNSETGYGRFGRILGDIGCDILCKELAVYNFVRLVKTLERAWGHVQSIVLYRSAIL